MNSDFLDGLTKSAYKTLESVIDVVRFNGESLIELVVKSKLASSNREAREFISNGAISIQGEKITDSMFNVGETSKAFDTYAIIRRGKKKYALIVF